MGQKEASQKNEREYIKETARKESEKKNRAAEGEQRKIGQFYVHTRSGAEEGLVLFTVHSIYVLYMYRLATLISRCYVTVNCCLVITFLI
jgi:hypothetical protein